jgi:c-di-GMP-binding flagellar brake protein YcgR
MYSPERRKHPRFTVSVPVEVHAEGSDTPIRCTTSDLSLGGCYIESMYPFPVGATLDLRLQLENTLLVEAKVVTSYPQVGNGMEFIRMLPEDRAELRAFLESLAKKQELTAAGKK